jgi:transcriptional regulator with XRE-family HTH domain
MKLITSMEVTMGTAATPTSITRINQADLAIGQRLQHLRRERLIDLLTIASCLEVDEDHVTDIEAGRVRLKAIEMFQLHDELSVPVKDFFSDPAGFMAEPISNEEAAVVAALSQQPFP